MTWVVTVDPPITGVPALHLADPHELDLDNRTDCSLVYLDFVWERERYVGRSLQEIKINVTGQAECFENWRTKSGCIDPIYQPTSSSFCGANPQLARDQFFRRSWRFTSSLVTCNIKVVGFYVSHVITQDCDMSFDCDPHAVPSLRESVAAPAVDRQEIGIAY